MANCIKVQERTLDLDTMQLQLERINAVLTLLSEDFAADVYDAERTCSEASRKMFFERSRTLYAPLIESASERAGSALYYVRAVNGTIV